MTANPSSKNPFPGLDNEFWAADLEASAVIERLRQCAGFVDRLKAARALCSWLRKRGLAIPEYLIPPPDRRRSYRPASAAGRLQGH